jgi:hypothetical protein
MKKKLCLFILSMLFSTASIFLFFGTTGPLTWNLSDGILTISGNGQMPNYSTTTIPWLEHVLSIHTVIMEDGITRIGSYAFLALNLTSVTIPESVTSIGNYAFYCSELAFIINHNPIPINLTDFTSVFSIVLQTKCTLKVPAASISDYQNAAGWKEFNIVAINVGIENIESTTVKVYPNPTTGELRIESGLQIESVVIYDNFGKTQKVENWKTEKAIDISHFSAGAYFVKISTEVGEVTRLVLNK